MRELKFRAWSEETKSFERFDLYEGTECGLTNLQIWARNSPIEQYTGLKDKNGEKIYEGDICKCSFGECGVVNYRHGEFCIVGDDIVGMSLWKEKAFEIVGNIHENPELLEE